MGRSTRENFFLIVLQTHLLHIFLKSEIFLVLYCEVFGTDRLFPYAHKSNLNGLIRDKCSWKRSFVFKAGTDRQRETERLEVSYNMASNTFLFNDKLKAVKNIPPIKTKS